MGEKKFKKRVIIEDRIVGGGSDVDGSNGNVSSVREKRRCSSNGFEKEDLKDLVKGNKKGWEKIS